MKSTIYFAFFALMRVALAVPPTPRELCGTGGTVINSTTVHHNGLDINIKTTTCPTLIASANSTSARAEKREEEERQTASCSDGGCTTYCLNLGEQPFVFDCQTLADALEDLYPESFLAPPQTSSEFSIDTCAFAFLNYDVEEYSVCYLNFGFNGIITADNCFGDWPAPTATAGGACLSPGYAGNDWAIE
ncbi:uncharacterized protein STEHIDRAFT_159404 [Stereum hirsutum FP-91666 SS1]|uniref:uncharacterized protein n=1 Tax=Stereum hirsutum (strain FP-91666) TaxID=721885 RepID=UPI0004449D89|nr:uncharacterized protein STEHIDRAFT_159404 [Stereum hirsutum FP-91666 SS1]EIM83782.1 hypothetical protein STEHIDRAFT_159404 [Stereum hirsutum FP-91666 SS1]